MFIKKSVKVFVLVVLVLAMSGFTYAFAAANTVPPTKAGDGAGAITGYDVTNIVYNLDLTVTPVEIASVEFDLNSTASFVTIRLVTTGGWYTCDTGTHITCTTAGATVSSANSLQVVASN